MLIKKIKLHNIRSYNESEIEFPEGSTILSGDIGSGKTTVLMAIEFALFGLQPGQKGSSLLKNGCDDGLIELELKVDGSPIILKRCLKRGKSITQDSASIRIDGKEQEMAITDLKNTVLQLLNYPMEFTKKTNLLYKFTVYTPQEEMKQIILENPETRLNTLRYIFGVDKYKRIRENTLLYTIKLRESIKIKDSLIKDIPEKTRKIGEKNSFIKEIIDRINETEKDLLHANKEKENVESSLKEIDKKIDEKRQLEKESEKTRILITGKKEILLSLNKEEEYIEKLKKEIEVLSYDPNALPKLNDEKIIKIKEEEALQKEFLEISSIVSSLSLKIEDIERLRKQILKIKLCPTCLQNVDNAYKENILAKFDFDDIEYKAKRDSCMKKRSEISSLRELHRNAIEQIDKQLQDHHIKKIKISSLEEKKLRLIEISKSKAVIYDDIKILESHITILKESMLTFSNLESLHKTRKHEYDLAQNKEKNAEIKIAELKKEIEITKREIAELQHEINEKERIKKDLASLMELEGWLSEGFLEIVSFIEKNIMVKLRDEFSRIFNQWFSLLVQDSFLVRLDEDFTPIIEQRDYELDYAYLSGGERTAVALAYRLALCQVINSMLSSIKTRDIIILDEPTDGFSEQQLDKMRDIFQQLKVKQLIVVSHEQKIESFVENIIKCKKENGISRIEI